MRPLYSRFLTLSILAFFTFNMVYSQSRDKEEKKGDKKIKNGEYQFAIDHYKTALSTTFGGDKARINFKIAEAYRLSNRLYLSKDFYENSLLEGENNENAKFYLAYSYKMNAMYKEAEDQFNAYLEVGSEIEFWEQANKELKVLKEVEKILTLVPNEFINIMNCNSINSEGSEYGPTILKDSSQNLTLVYTSSNGEEIYPATGYGFTRLYKMDIKDSLQNTGNISKIELPVSFPKGNFNIGTATFTDNGKTIIFARGNSGYKKDKLKEVSLFISEKKDTTWSTPEALPFSTLEYWDAAPTFSADGKTLYFASNRPGGKGGLDLYRVKRNKSGTWGQPQNLGDKINTLGNESFPWVSDDGKLYFASDGHAGLGGLDIFVASKKNKRTQVLNVGPKFNSSFDDFGLVYNDTLSGYFSSNRGGGKGEDDIYFFLDKTPPKFDFFVEVGLRYGKDGGNDKDGNFFAGEPILNANVVVLKKKNIEPLSTEEIQDVKLDMVNDYSKKVQDSLVNNITADIQKKIIDDYKEELTADLKVKMEKETGEPVAREYINNVADSVAQEFIVNLQDSLSQAYAEEIQEDKDAIINEFSTYIEDSLANPIASETDFEEVGEFTTGKYGKLKFKMDPDAEYEFVMAKDGVLTKRVSFKSPTVEDVPIEELVANGINDSTFRQEYELDKPQIGDVISMKSGENDYDFDEILYDYNSYYFDHKENLQIDKLSRFLKDNNNLKIEISSHCDDRGTDIYNLRLSQKRANFVVDYLIAHGIPESSVLARGYGKFSLKVENAQSEDEHRVNRRTEIKILSIDPINTEALEAENTQVEENAPAPGGEEATPEEIKTLEKETSVEEEEK
ncbi:MAG: OmpA family protein [Flammeovirgaceae bacterium]|nr:OmpA family protein [Flammeovirgaceae bacterium]